MASPEPFRRRALQLAGHIVGVLALVACGSGEPAQTSSLVTVNISICQETCRTIDGVQVPVGASVIDAMAAADEAGSLTVRWKGAGPLAFVTEIDGVSAPKDGRYWLLWVDGAFACVGPGDLHLESDASVEWRLTAEGGSCA